MEHVTLDEFTLTGLSLRTNNQAEMDPQKAGIGKLWQAVGQAIESSGGKPEGVFGAYHNYASDENGDYDLTAGTREPFPGENTRSVTVPSGTYIKFTRSGPPMEAAMATWQEVWTYFQQPDAEERTFVCDLEAYSGTDTLELFIGIKEED